MNAFAAAVDAAYVASMRLQGALLAVKAVADPESPLAIIGMNEACKSAAVLATRMSEVTAAIAAARAIVPRGREGA